MKFLIEVADLEVADLEDVRQTFLVEADDAASAAEIAIDQINERGGLEVLLRVRESRGD